MANFISEKVTQYARIPAEDPTNRVFLTSLNKHVNKGAETGAWAADHISQVIAAGSRKLFGDAGLKPERTALVPHAAIAATTEQTSGAASLTPPPVFLDDANSAVGKVLYAAEQIIAEVGAIVGAIVGVIGHGGQKVIGADTTITSTKGARYGRHVAATAASIPLGGAHAAVTVVKSAVPHACAILTSLGSFAGTIVGAIIGVVAGLVATAKHLYNGPIHPVVPGNSDPIVETGAQAVAGVADAVVSGAQAVAEGAAKTSDAATDVAHKESTSQPVTESVIGVVTQPADEAVTVADVKPATVAVTEAA